MPAQLALRGARGRDDGRVRGGADGGAGSPCGPRRGRRGAVRAGWRRARWSPPSSSPASCASSGSACTAHQTSQQRRQSGILSANNSQSMPQSTSRCYPRKAPRARAEQRGGRVGAGAPARVQKAGGAVSGHAESSVAVRGAPRWADRPPDGRSRTRAVARSADPDAGRPAATPMDDINLEDFDVDGAIGEAADAVEGDTRLSFLEGGRPGRRCRARRRRVLSALTPGTSPAPARRVRPPKFGKGDIGILNYALTLEYLEARLLPGGRQERRTLSDPGASGAVPRSSSLRDERAHVKEPEGRPRQRRPSRSRSSTSAGHADATRRSSSRPPAALENTGVRAYSGQAVQHQEPGLPEGRRVDPHDRGAPRRHHRASSTTRQAARARTPSGAFDKPLRAASRPEGRHRHEVHHRLAGRRR